MTRLAFAEELGSRLPSSDERAAANQLRRILASNASDDSTLKIFDGDTKKPSEITLTPSLSKLLTELLRHIGSGDAVTLVPVSQMLSTQQAADILNVSRPFLISLLDKGEIDFELVGRHRRIKAETLFAYKNARKNKRATALDKLGELDGETLWAVFANRYTAFIDACTLASALRRNLLLTLAEAEFFRIRWSIPVLDETERAIEKILIKKGFDVDSAQDRASRARHAMEHAFEEAVVEDFQAWISSCGGMPDSDDVHVLAAALKTQAATIVTENIKDFPAHVLTRLNIEARTADAFIADTIALDIGRAVAAIHTMRLRFKRPEKSAEILLLDMEAADLTETVDVLRPHIASL